MLRVALVIFCLIPRILLAREGAADAGAPAGIVDLRIILSVDASGSIDPRELRLQLGGLAAAVRAPEVQDAVRAGPSGAILAAMLIWSDASYPKYRTGWLRLSDPASFEAFAREIESYRVLAPGVPALGGGGTNIGDALAYALNMLDAEPTRAVRDVIDVSGDGPETEPWVKGAMRLPQARALARARGVTVNGLAIENEVANLRLYYEKALITGPGAFVEVARGFDDYREAMVRKLLRELQDSSLDAVELRNRGRGGGSSGKAEPAGPSRPG